MSCRGISEFFITLQMGIFFMFSSLVLNAVRTLPTVVSRSNPTLLVVYTVFIIGKEVITYMTENDSKSKN